MSQSQNDNPNNLKNISNGNNNGSSPSQVDSAHLRFREKWQLTKVYCFSCNQNFEVTNQYEINMHFEIKHDKSHSYCLYCNGKTHLYKSDNGLKEHHFCASSKRNGET